MEPYIEVITPCDYCHTVYKHCIPLGDFHHNRGVVTQVRTTLAREGWHGKSDGAYLCSKCNYLGLGGQTAKTSVTEVPNPPMPGEAYGNANAPECAPSIFIQELARLIDRHNVENESNTPALALAEYANDCLHAWGKAIACREEWHGRGRSPLPREWDIGTNEAVVVEAHRVVRGVRAPEEEGDKCN